MAIQLADGRFEYIMLADRGSETPTVFHIKEFNANERRKICEPFLGLNIPSEATGKELQQAADKLHDGYMSVCRAGLLSAGPFFNRKNELVELDIDAVLNGIRTTDEIQELGLAVIRANKLEDDEGKKSEELPRPGQQD
ncbi:hypothetical protein [Mariprofundus ferrooxydans]|uniref:hypothetical protein n=1 Tax=Mariprofundus ferrooxydans TaxID=314344 RepID=UPI0014315CBA|nr:hypothetical protein [Mariprofundus ferrooxydans]